MKSEIVLCLSKCVHKWRWAKGNIILFLYFFFPKTLTNIYIRLSGYRIHSMKYNFWIFNSHTFYGSRYSSHGELNG